MCDFYVAEKGGDIRSIKFFSFSIQDINITKTKSGQIQGHLVPAGRTTYLAGTAHTKTKT